MVGHIGCPQPAAIAPKRWRKRGGFGAGSLGWRGGKLCKATGSGAPSLASSGALRPVGLLAVAPNALSFLALRKKFVLLVLPRARWARRAARRRVLRRGSPPAPCGRRGPPPPRRLPRSRWSRPVGVAGASGERSRRKRRHFFRHPGCPHVVFLGFYLSKTICK